MANQGTQMNCTKKKKQTKNTNKWLIHITQHMGQLQKKKNLYVHFMTTMVIVCRAHTLGVYLHTVPMYGYVIYLSKLCYLTYRVQMSPKIEEKNPRGNART